MKRFTFVVSHREKDGAIYPGIVKEEKEAREAYEEAISQGQNAGLVSQR